tara:strand:+ start:39304 stop:40041 length:738 start_codon:yes stop_codon:yes gene_type:complete
MLRLLLTLSFLFFSLASFAQQDSLVVQYDTAPIELKKISEDDLSSYRDNPEYNYEVDLVESTWWNDVQAWFYNWFRRFMEWIFGVDAAVGAMAFFLKLIPYLLLFFLIFLLIRFFIHANLRSMKNAALAKSSVGLSEEENIIKNENIDDLIQNAIANKEYRLAVRYYYLQILKLLSEKEIIAWELQKTNSDYLYELSQHDLKNPFATVTRWYDYIWYGDFEIDETKYQKVAITFDELKNRLKKNA